jgi:glycosyltransferase involved in cell wall biosynthesis
LKQKRILLLDLGSVKGGVETYLERLAEILQGSAELDCICILPELARNLQAHGVKVTLLPRLGAATKPLAFLFTGLLLPVVVVRDRVDAVQVNGFLEAIFLPLVRLLGREAIYTRHGPFEDNLYSWYRNPRRFLPRYLSRICARFSSRIICVSEDTRKDVLGVVPEERAFVIQHWMPSVPPYTQRAATLTAPARLLCVARLEEYKGIHLVIEALRSLPAAVPGVRLTVVGKGSYRAELERLAAGLDVEFAGYTEDPTKYYVESDIFIMPSKGPEGSCMGAIEAMTYGLPCLLSDLPVYEELTGFGRAGAHFRCGDASDLRRQLATLLSDSQARLKYSREGYAMVQQKYSPEVARRLYIEAFKLTESRAT